MPPNDPSIAITMDAPTMVVFDNEVLSPVAAWQRAQDKAKEDNQEISMYSFFKVRGGRGEELSITSSQPVCLYDNGPGALSLLLSANFTKVKLLVEWKVNQSKTFVPCGVALVTNIRLTTPSMKKVQVGS